MLLCLFQEVEGNPFAGLAGEESLGYQGKALENIL